MGSVVCVASQPALAGDPGSAESLASCLIARGLVWSPPLSSSISSGGKSSAFIRREEVFLGSLPRAECTADAAGGRMFQVAPTRAEFTHWLIRRLLKRSQWSQRLSVSVTVLCFEPRQEGPARVYFIPRSPQGNAFPTTQFLSGS